MVWYPDCQLRRETMILLAQGPTDNTVWAEPMLHGKRKWTERTPPGGRVFILHAADDKDLVDRLALDFAKSGIPVWYDSVDRRTGEDFAEKLDEALEDARYLVVVLSSSSVSSAGAETHLDSSLIRRLTSNGTFLVPILAGDVEIPAVLRHRQIADFRCQYDAPLRELMNTWAMDRAVESELLDKSVYPWPDCDISDREFLYLHSARFEKAYRMSCPLHWTSQRAADSAVSTLGLPREAELPALGLRFSFAYRLTRGDRKLPLSTSLAHARVASGDVVTLAAASTCEDLFEKQLADIWAGPRPRKVSAAFEEQARLKEIIRQRGRLTPERLRHLADSFFSHLDSPAR
jgi:hypothetical protein